MSTAITIRFKLHGDAADMARALHQQVCREVAPLSMDEIIKRQFISWMQTNVIPPPFNMPEQQGGPNEHPETVEAEADIGSDTQAHEVASAGDTLLTAEEARPGTATE